MLLKNCRTIALIFGAVVTLFLVRCFPVPVSVSSLSTPTPVAAPLYSFSQIPTPIPGRGVVWGVLVDQKTGSAPPDSFIYLGEVDKLDAGVPVIVVDRNNAYYSPLSNDGLFIITNIIPGTYGIVLITPDISMLLANPADGKTITFTIQSNTLISIPRIEIPLP
jgi:hypothetical protein